MCHAANKAQWKLDESERLLAQWRVIRIDSDAAAVFERLRNVKGIRRIGRRDLLIANIAIAHDATLVTRNVRDFELIPGLTIENWVDE